MDGKLGLDCHSLGGTYCLNNYTPTHLGMVNFFVCNALGKT
jgi:hypothetical protein